MADIWIEAGRVAARERDYHQSFLIVAISHCRMHCQRQTAGQRNNEPFGLGRPNEGPSS